MNFIYCFSQDIKLSLEKNNYTFIKEVALENQVAFLFMNNGNKLNFNKKEVVYSNKLNF